MESSNTGRESSAARAARRWVLLAAAAAAAVPSAAFAGAFTATNVGTGDSDASVGISTDKYFVLAVDLQQTGAAPTVNGVAFTAANNANPSGTGSDGTGWSLAGVGQVFGGGGTNPGGALGQLTNQFVYGGNPATFTLTGLTVGQTYVQTFYNRSWEGANNRVQRVTASGASTGSVVFDEDIAAAAQGSLNVLRYSFTATTATQVLSFAPVNTGNTMHFYGFTTQAVFGSQAWTGASGGNWSDSNNWSAGVPDAQNADATFPAPAAPTTVTVDADHTVGYLSLSGSGANVYTLAGTGTIATSVDAGAAANVAVITTPTGSHAVSAPLRVDAPTLKLGAGTLTVTGPVSGSGSIGVGEGTLVLASAPTNTGGTTVRGGTLTVSVSGKLGPVNVGLTIDGGTLDLAGTTQTVGQVNASGYNNGASGTIQNGRLDVTGNVYLRSGTVTATFGGSSAGRLWIGGDAGATVVLNGTNDHVYTTDHHEVIIGYTPAGGTGAAGVVQVGNPNALAAATEEVQVFSGTLDLNGVAAVRAGGLQLLGGTASNLVNAKAASAASFAGPVGLTTGAVSNVGGAGDLTLSGVISNGTGAGTSTGGIKKVGAGALTLTAASGYTGPTQVSAGSVVLSGAGSLASTKVLVGTVAAETSATLNVAGVTGGFAVKSGQTLAGFGVVSGAATVGSGGTVDPGDTTIVGTLNTGNLTFASGSTLSIDLAAGTTGGFGNSDRLAVTGALDLSATQTLTLANPAVLDGVSTYRIATYTGALTGTFDSSNVPVTYTINYGTTTPNAITLVPVPEPTAVAGVLLAAGAGLLRRRRSRR